MIVKENDLIKIELKDSWGFKKDSASKVLSILDKSKPLFFIFHSPHSFEAFFSIKTNNQVIHNLSSKIKSCCLEYSDELESPSLRVGSGLFTYKVNLIGRIKTLPMGRFRESKDSSRSWQL